MNMIEFMPYILSLTFMLYASEHFIGTLSLVFLGRFVGITRKPRLGDKVEFRLRIIETIASAYIAIVGAGLALSSFNDDSIYLYGT